MHIVYTILANIAQDIIGFSMNWVKIENCIDWIAIYTLGGSQNWVSNILHSADCDIVCKIFWQISDRDQFQQFC